MSIGPLGINLSEILIKIQNFSFTKVHLEISSVKWWPLCPRGDQLNATTNPGQVVVGGYVQTRNINPVWKVRDPWDAHEW